MLVAKTRVPNIQGWVGEVKDDGKTSRRFRDSCSRMSERHRARDLRDVEEGDAEDAKRSVLDVDVMEWWSESEAERRKMSIGRHWLVLDVRGCLG